MSTEFERATSANSVITFGTSTASGVTSALVARSYNPGGALPVDDEALVNAAYGYIQAIRALGRNTATTAEIARALAIDEWRLIAVLPKLKSRGVR